MLNKFIRGIFTVLGFLVGYLISELLIKLDIIKNIIHLGSNSVTLIITYSICIALFGFIFYIISPFIINFVWRTIELMENWLQKIPTNEIIIGASGLIIGLIIANLIVGSFTKLFIADKILSIIGSIISIVTNIIFGVLGLNIAIKKREDFYNIFTFLRRFGKDKKGRSDGKLSGTIPKILDTSVIIDGRILDILKTGFIEGPIVIPSFILEELRHIADSSDSLKRTRGRRGLDILNEIQKDLPLTVEICEKDFQNIQEVDSKLLKLGETMGGKIITNDFNLNKVAEFQGVPVLNINELANSIKPVVIPGEEMHIQIVKDGKEAGQGVAYLDDGTMIVVEGGKKYLSESVDVIVTSVLQTAAGRMIFARIKTSQDKAV